MTSLTPCACGKSQLELWLSPSHRADRYWEVHCKGCDARSPAILAFGDDEAAKAVAATGWNAGARR